MVRYEDEEETGCALLCLASATRVTLIFDPWYEIKLQKKAYWKFPGGSQYRNEPPRVGAVRELKEETFIDLRADQKVELLQEEKREVRIGDKLVDYLPALYLAYVSEKEFERLVENAQDESLRHGKERIGPTRWTGEETDRNDEKHPIIVEVFYWNGLPHETLFKHRPLLHLARRAVEQKAGRQIAG